MGLTKAQAAILNRLNANSLVLQVFTCEVQEMAKTVDDTSKLIEFSTAVSRYRAIVNELKLVARLADCSQEQIDEACTANVEYYAKGK